MQAKIKGFHGSVGPCHIAVKTKAHIKGKMKSDYTSRNTQARNRVNEPKRHSCSDASIFPSLYSFKLQSFAIRESSRVLREM